MSSGIGGKTLGPPIFELSRPLAARCRSRTISPSTRRRFWRCEQLVLRIDVGELGTRRAALAVGGAEHDGPDELLPAPAVFHERRREPVEQFRMRRTLAAHAEVGHGAHESFAEQTRPDVVHGHARGERILRGSRASARGRGGRAASHRAALSSAGSRSVAGLHLIGRD